MKKGIMRLEGLDETQADVDLLNKPPLTVAEVALASGIDQTEKAQLNTQIAEERIDEANSVVGVVAELNEDMQSMVDSGEAISVATSATLHKVMEHFRQRLGSRVPLAFPTMEGNSDSRDSMLTLLAYGKRLEKDGGDAIVLTTEGFFGRVINNIRSNVQTSKSITKNAKEASEKYDNGTLRAEMIDTPDWGRYLNPNGKKEITAADVIAQSKKFTGPELQRAIDDVKVLEKTVMDWTLAMNKNFFVAKNNSLDKIEEANNAAKKHIDSLLEHYPEFVKSKTDANFKPVDAKEKKQLLAVVDQLILTDSLERALNSYCEAANLCSTTFYDAVDKRLGGAFAADLRMVNNGINQQGKAVSGIFDILHDRTKLAHHILSYIKASVK